MVEDMSSKTSLHSGHVNPRRNMQKFMGDNKKGKFSFKFLLRWKETKIFWGQ